MGRNLRRPRRRRSDFSEHADAIREASIALAAELGKTPTQQQLADRTGLSRRTVSKHLKKGELN